MTNCRFQKRTKNTSGHFKEICMMVITLYLMMVTNVIAGQNWMSESMSFHILHKILKVLHKIPDSCVTNLLLTCY